MANINDSKDIDSLSSKISDAIRIIADVKIWQGVALEDFSSRA
jgi:hypothetical protein